MDSKKFGNFN